jgi:predicted ATPase
MLSFLGLNNVGPAPELKMQLGSRLNVITGDNGLGKSFLLEVAWWALTQTWLQEINPELTSGHDQPLRKGQRESPLRGGSVQI